MSVRVAINGFGRIGRNVLRAIHESGRSDLAVVAIKLYIPDKEEEALMQGLAEASGGAYKWQRKPP